MKATGAGASRKELALIRKTLKANPGCSIVWTVGRMACGGYPLRHGTDRAAQLARLKADARRADLLLLQARVQESELVHR
jgi:hypothetical protein